MQRYRTTGWSYDISEKEEMAEVICLVQLCWHYRENVSVIKPATGRVSAAVLQLTAHETVGLYSAAPQGKGGHRSRLPTALGKCTQPSVHRIKEAIPEKLK